jgi:hypothetical protein
LKEKTIYGKEITFYASLTIIITFFKFGFKPLRIRVNEWFSNKTQMNSIFISISKRNYTDLNIPFTGNLFVGFKTNAVLRIKNKKKINFLRLF